MNIFGRQVSPRQAIVVGVAACLVLVLALIVVVASCQGQGTVGSCTVNAVVTADVTIPDGSAVAAGAGFTKTWRIQNTGSCSWEQGTLLAYISGDPLGGPSSVSVPIITAGSMADVSVNFVAPASPGAYRSNWSMQGPTGAQFGPQIHVAIVVAGGSSAPTSSSTPTAPAATPTEGPTLPPLHTPVPTPTPAPFGGGLGRIAYTSNRDGNFEIYTMGSTDAAPTRLTSSPEIDDHPSWSHDGAKIAFERILSSKPDIFVMNANGSGQTNVTNSASYDTEPAWSPDGGHIAFASDRVGGRLQIWTMKPDGSALTQLTNAASISSSPAYSPDGSYIAFETTRDGSREIYIMKTDGSAQTRLTFSGNNYGPSWSPDSSKIVWSRGDGLYVMNANGSSQTQLTHDVGPLVLDVHPSWSPDGSMIVFDTDRSGNSDLWVVKPNGTGMQQITINSASDLNPSWR